MLQAAFEKGPIKQREYDKKRKTIMEQI